MSDGARRRQALRAFGKRLGLKATAAGECAMLDTALTHDSYVHEKSGRSAGLQSNERLEFLGDAALGLIVGRALHDRFAQESEGRLSRRRAALISRSALAQTAQRVGIGLLLRLGKGESAAHGEQRPSILAAAFEAIVGAVYVTEGFEAAARFVERQHLAHAASVSAADPKTALQELTQERFSKTPSYATSGESGPPHSRVFSATVSIDGDVLGKGSGPTKKQAQTQAAAEALHRLRSS
ncbi:MAG TPA: ribonuclease III [Candidatus Tumulicola sp.]|nr:ribonuclease III [Candidatus Tumulicola sp.]